jgi:hypothetical protein
MMTLRALRQHCRRISGIEAGESAVAADHGVERGGSSEVAARTLDPERAEDGLRTDALATTFWTRGERWRWGGSGIRHMLPPWQGCGAGSERVALAEALGTGTHR